jgi:tRNA(adenine34) deaminase
MPNPIAPHKPTETADLQHMQAALAQARLALADGEVPVGAVVVKDGQVIASGRNAPVQSHDPTAHAEVVALRAAGQVLGNYRLDGCTLYVTLEPCAMCAGAMLHSRLHRVVYASADPKTGAAGSVLNLFEHQQLNHQTQVQGGVLATASSQLLQTFFQSRRAAAKQANPMNQPLREDALRTPDDAFANLPGYPWAPRYISDLPSLGGLRMHFLDEGHSSANPNQITWLCLHGNPSWSYIYRKMIPILLQSGGRVVAPDLVGFGKSDKPKKDAAHSFGWHRQVLLELVEALDLRNVALVVQDWGGLLGLTLPPAAPQRYRHLLVMNTTLGSGDAALSPGFLAWRDMCAKNPLFDIARLFARGNPHLTAAESAAYMAPFPDAGHRAATRAFPAMVPDHPDADGAAVSRQARAFWQTHWQGSSLMAVGLQDPVLGLPVMEALRSSIRNCPPPMLVEQGGHFLQEHGEAIARAAVAAFVKPEC